MLGDEVDQHFIVDQRRCRQRRILDLLVDFDGFSAGRGELDPDARLTRATARELGEYDITVNAISPGPIDTDIMGGTLSQERKDDLTKDLVVNRVGSTRDIAAAIAFLISEDAGYISGQTLNVDGGLYMH